MANYSSLDCSLFKKIICGGARQLEAHKSEINSLNVFPVPDGDTGDNMFLTFSSGVNAMIKSGAATLGESAAALSHGMLLGARGNSGVILSQFFGGMSKKFENKESATAEELAEAFSSGVRQAYRAVASPAEGTILTVAREGVENARAEAESDSVCSLIESIKEKMSDSLANTPALLPVLREAGVVDSGGAGLYYIIEGMSNALSGKNSDISFETAVRDTSGKTTDNFSAFTKDSVMTYGYCTELLLRLQTSKVNVDSFDERVITEYLGEVGDSIVSFKEGTIVKVHVHTMTPEKVLGFCRRFGEFLTVKIENMSVQHSEKFAEQSKTPENPEQSVPEKEYGTVAVCSGDGIKDTFTDLGVDCIIDGGQTNNPSTEDFFKAFDKVHARHIFVFPNNSNIILTARQAAEMYKSSEIHVLESKDLGSGYVGVASIDNESASADEIISAVNEAMANSVTGCVAPAVRTADIGGVHIESGDNICFVGKKMIGSGKERTDALHSLADYILEDDEKFMLTAFFGKDLTSFERDDLRAYMKKNHPDIEFYTVDGGQAVYSCILVAE